LTKIVVANGLGASDKYLDSIEVIDLSSEAKHCQNLPDFPILVKGQVGGIIYENTTLLCGGHSHKKRIDLCYALHKNNSWIQASCYRQFDPETTQVKIRKFEKMC
jgi:hypothetical protein